VVAGDFSPGMIAEGRRRHGHVPNVTFVEADAMALPFADGEFDVVTISFGLRNVNDPKKALAEMLRVTAPGGMLLVCEFSHPQNPRSRPLPVLQRPDPADGGAQRELERRRVRLPQRVDQGLARPGDAVVVDPRCRLDPRRPPRPHLRHRRAAPRVKPLV
jgi:SAM-dependent methyltransferase